MRALSVIGVRDLPPVHPPVAAALECLDEGHGPTRNAGGGRG